MGRRDETAAAIAARTAALQGQVRRSASAFSTTRPGADAYGSTAEELFEATDRLLEHEAEIPELHAKARLAGKIRVGQWTAALTAAWAGLLAATVPLEWISAPWLVLLIPLALAGLFCWALVGDIEDEAQVRPEVAIPAFAAAGLGVLLAATHVLSAYLLDMPVLFAGALGVWALVGAVVTAP